MSCCYHQKGNGKWTFKNMDRRQEEKNNFYSGWPERKGFLATGRSNYDPAVTRSPARRSTHLTWPSSRSAPRENSFWSKWSSAPEEGLSLSAASRGWAALELLFSSEDEEELCERSGTCKLRCCTFLSASIPADLFSHSFLFTPFTLPKPTSKKAVDVNTVNSKAIYEKYDNLIQFPGFTGNCF